MDEDPGPDLRDGDGDPPAGVPLHPIAHISTEFSEKFGIPRQAGLVPELRARVVLEPEFRVAEALRGLEDFSWIWLLWVFSASRRDHWSPTVRPPRLGGNTRLGVFATRSPYRPNPIGLSSVRLDAITEDPVLGPVLEVSGADLLDGTPILDLKPYLAADSHPDATQGFTATNTDYGLAVVLPEAIVAAVPAERLTAGRLAALRGVLAQDPRPPYQDDPQRLYGMSFAGLDVRFTVADGVLTVREITPST